MGIRSYIAFDILKSLSVKEQPECALEAPLVSHLPCGSLFAPFLHIPVDVYVEGGRFGGGESQ